MISPASCLTMGQRNYGLEGSEKLFRPVSSHLPKVTWPSGKRLVPWNSTKKIQRSNYRENSVSSLGLSLCETSPIPKNNQDPLLTIHRNQRASPCSQRPADVKSQRFVSRWKKVTVTFSVLYSPLRARDRTQVASTASGQWLSTLVCRR